MTKKHFIAIAATFAHAAGVATSDEKALLRSLADSQADVFATINSNFDRQRFLDACQLSDR